MAGGHGHSLSGSGSATKTGDIRRSKTNDMPRRVTMPAAAEPLRNNNDYHAATNGTGTAQTQHAVKAVLQNAKNQQLRGYVQRLRAAWSPGTDPGHVDGAFEEYAGMQKAAMDLARALALYPGSTSHRQASVAPRKEGHGSVEETVGRLEMLTLGSSSAAADAGELDALGACFGGMGISDETDAAQVRRGQQQRHQQQPKPRRTNDAWLATVRDWRAAVQKLLDSHRASLAWTYRAYREGDGAEETTERLFVDLDFRAAAIHRMRNSSHTTYKAFATAPAYWPRYERRFRNYDCLKRALEDVERLLRWERVVEDGEDDGRRRRRRRRRPVRDYIIAPRGDAILEFANTGAHDAETPVLRFRVSSHMLSETSPVFSRLFSSSSPSSSPSSSTPAYEATWHDEDDDGPCPPPRPVVLPDNSTAKLYAMPQHEPNAHSALTILLHAAHMHTDARYVPRAIGDFAQFVAIAETCLRYRCTSPLEVFVEHCWLPAWVHRAWTGDRPDGLLVISYAFGLRRLFARVSKSAVLGVVDEEELAAKGWPRRVKERIWAVRNAKLAQVYAVCTSAIQEYFRPPMGHHPSPRCSPLPRIDNRPSSSPQPPRFTFTGPAPPNPPVSDADASLFSLTSTPRCPKASHACDASNLGWLLLVLNELHLLGAGAVSVMHTAALTQSQRVSPRRSLAELLDALRCVPGPPGGGGGQHGGVCDPVPAFRAAVDDVFNSVTGLTLLEVDGKREGWALSRGPGDEEGASVELGGVLAQERDELGDDLGYTEAEATENEDGDLSSHEEHDTNMAIDTPYSHQIPATYPRRSSVAFTPDAPICQRILSHLSTSDDLYSAAMTNRTFYTAFKHNELAFMRRLVRANRRLTLSTLIGQPGEERNMFHYPERGTERVSSSAGDSDLPDSGCVMTSDDGSLENNGRDLWGAGSSLTNKQVYVPGSPPRYNNLGQEPSSVMTEEEAHQILWPDQQPGKGDAAADGYVCRGVSDSNAGSQPVDADPRSSEDCEKVLLGHVAFVEEKTLVVVGDKSLREQHDRRLGIVSEYA